MAVVYPKSRLTTLPSGAQITGIELDKIEQGSAANIGSLKIYLANSSATTLTEGSTLASFTSTATLVYQSSAQSVPAATGWWSPGALTTPFTYMCGAAAR